MYLGFRVFVSFHGLCPCKFFFFFYLLGRLMFMSDQSWSSCCTLKDDKKHGRLPFCFSLVFFFFFRDMCHGWSTLKLSMLHIVGGQHIICLTPLTTRHNSRLLFHSTRFACCDFHQVLGMALFYYSRGTSYPLPGILLIWRGTIVKRTKYCL